MSIRVDNAREQLELWQESEGDPADLAEATEELINYAETLEEGLRSILTMPGITPQNIREWAADLVAHVNTYLDDSPQDLPGAGVPSDMAVAAAQAAAAARGEEL